MANDDLTENVKHEPIEINFRCLLFSLRLVYVMGVNIIDFWGNIKVLHKILYSVDENKKMKNGDIFMIT